MTSDEAATKLMEMSSGVPDELIRFGRALDDAGFLEDGYAYFLEKPWKWADEYMEWEHRDRPAPDDDVTWDEWLEAVQ